MTLGGFILTCWPIFVSRKRGVRSWPRPTEVRRFGAISRGGLLGGSSQLISA